MRTSTIGAALLLAGAGASLAAAAGTDTTGSGTTTAPYNLNGSDTLHDVTVDVLSACNTALTAANGGVAQPVGTLQYLGGGSGIGSSAMKNGAQGLAPMSKPLGVSDYCSPPAVATIYASPLTPVAASNGSTEGILVGIDGVSITANQVTACASPTTGAANGFGAAAMSVVAGGTGTGAPSSCPGCDNGTTTYTFGQAPANFPAVTGAAPMYTGQASFDALAVLYFGLTHDGVYSGCGSDVRKSLIKNWKNLFSSDCGTTIDGICSSGLTHAWRRSDLAGTTDAFVSVLIPPAGTDANLKGVVRDATIPGQTLGAKTPMGVGNLPTVAGAAEKSNPFCNSADAQTFANLTANPATSATQSFGGSSDFQDKDPVRTTCTAGDDVCEATLNFAAAGGGTGDLGVVVPIFIPDGTIVNKTTDVYSQNLCSASCTLVAVGSTLEQAGAGNYPKVTKCPDGTSFNNNDCYMPYFVNPATGDLDARCISAKTTKCSGAAGKPDGRVYNQVVVVAASIFSGTGAAYPGSGTLKLGQLHGNKEYQFGIDANGRLLTGSYFRVHTSHSAPNRASGLGTETGTTGLCAENDDTSQIGCLVDADPCTVGYAGRESAKGYPGTCTTDNGVTTCVPTSQQLKGLAVQGITPYTPQNNGDGTFSYLDTALSNLLVAGTPTPLYPLARRLYVATQYGFGRLQGGEAQLASCFGTDSVVDSIVAKHGFVVPTGGVSCVDYPEDQGTTTPPPNVNGTGNVALGGCGTASVNTDACTTYPLIETDGITTLPEAHEAFNFNDGQ